MADTGDPASVASSSHRTLLAPLGVPFGTPPPAALPHEISLVYPYPEADFTTLRLHTLASSLDTTAAFT